MAAPRRLAPTAPLPDIMSRMDPKVRAAITEQAMKPVHERLMDELLVLYTILKDRDDDTRCGRVFIPTDTKLHELFALARHDLSEGVCTASQFVGNGKPLYAT